MATTIGNQFTLQGSVYTPKLIESGNSVDDSADGSWVRTAFTLSKDEFTSAIDLQNRYWTTSEAKFVDGRYGCNIGVNCPPQFTPYADIPAKGRIAGRRELSIHDSTGNYGLGSYWGEMFDDNAQIVYFRFGVPEFNGVFHFFSEAFDYKSAVMARTGRTPGILYDGAKLIGTYITFKAMPYLMIPALIFKTLDWFFFRRSARFYHLKPTMHLYWGSVNTLVNALALNSGIYPKVMGQNKEDGQRLGQPLEIDQDNLDVYHKLAPDIFDSNNYIDVFALANRAQRVANHVLREEFEALDTKDNTSFKGWLDKEILGDGRHRTNITGKEGKVGFMEYIDKFLKFQTYYEQKTGMQAASEPDPRTAKQENTDDPLYPSSFRERVGQHLDAEFRTGSQFAIFRVDHSGSVTESWQNSSTPSDLENKFNATSSSFAHQRFSVGDFADVGAMVQGMVGSVKDLAAGALSGLTLNLSDAAMGLMGEGFVDIPEHWQSSSWSPPRSTYKMQLVTPYGNVISRIMRLFVPFAMVAAGTWPRSTGRQSYTSPFICTVYDQGRVQVPLGMITEMSVIRGGGNLGFTKDKKPLSLEVSWTVRDFSRILHMPLMATFDNATPTMIDEESSITNYLAAVAGMSIETQVYPATRAKVRLAKQILNYGVVSSPAFWGSFGHATTTQSLLKYAGVGPLLEILVRNTNNTSGSVF